MWSYGNPVDIRFGANAFDGIAAILNGRRYALITYPEPAFRSLTLRLGETAGDAALVIKDVAPNPDFVLLAEQCARFASLDQPVEVIVAVGGGSVIDSAKVFSAASGNFGRVRQFLENKTSGEKLSAIPIIAVPTTAGTGSEVTCWATVWDKDSLRKYSLARTDLYPEVAIVDPRLMLAKPRDLTLATGLDALSHALESIWNINANPVSSCLAVTAARDILECLPRLVDDLGNQSLRERMAKAALFAGLAFSNTKTAIAHNISYPMTLEYEVPHGIACSFTLPAILRSVGGVGGFREASLRDIFDRDLLSASEWFSHFLTDIGVRIDPSKYGVPPAEWKRIVDDAFDGERGRNFVGDKTRFYESLWALQLL